LILSFCGFYLGIVTFNKGAEPLSVNHYRSLSKTYISNRYILGTKKGVTNATPFYGQVGGLFGIVNA
jgi:hypothetical protein